MQVGPGYGTQDIQHNLTKQAALNNTQVPSLAYSEAYPFISGFLKLRVVSDFVFGTGVFVGL